METSSSRRTAKKLRDTNSWKGDDFGHGWHFREGRLGGVGAKGKNHTDSMRRLHDKALVAAGIAEDSENFELDMAEAAQFDAYWFDNNEDYMDDFNDRDMDIFDFFLAQDEDTGEVISSRW